MHRNRNAIFLEEISTVVKNRNTSYCTRIKPKNLNIVSHGSAFPTVVWPFGK
jgi:hypothetical protein